MNVLAEDTIKRWILPSLSVGKRGPKLSEDDKFRIVQAILFKLKTGTQWEFLPMKQFFDRDYSYKSVFYHFNRWVKDKSWLKVWVIVLKENKRSLDLSSVSLDGSHTPCKRGGEQVAYQNRKRSQTTNSLFIADSKGQLLAISTPEAGNHHDLFDIEAHFEELLSFLESCEIPTKGLFLNADAGFDSHNFRQLCIRHHIEANIAFNARQGSIIDRDEYFDEELYKERTFIEHSFAWMDAFKALIIRYETKVSNWVGFNIIAMTVLFLRKIKPA